MTTNKTCYANWISFSRIILAFGILALVIAKPMDNNTYYLAFVLTLICIWMDGLDGFVARKFNESSKLGSVIDILSDRIVEMTFWIAFATWQWVPLWAPIIVMSRGIVVDGVRGLALSQGFTAFGENSMMKHPLGILLVSSRFSRWTYAATKAVVFSTAFLVFSANHQFFAYRSLFNILVIITLVFCIIRALPVIIEAKKLV